MKKGDLVVLINNTGIPNEFRLLEKYRIKDVKQSCKDGGTSTISLYGDLDYTYFSEERFHVLNSNEYRKYRHIVDLDGLTIGDEDDTLAYLAMDEKSPELHLVFNGNYIRSYESVVDVEECRFIKSLGFNIERVYTIEELAEEFDEVPFVNQKKNWFIQYDNICKHYEADYIVNTQIYGVKYFTENTAKSIAEKLNTWGDD